MSAPPDGRTVLRALEVLRAHHVACETCGASAYGSVFCIACLRWQKRLWREKFGNAAEFLRILIKIAARAPYTEYDRAES